MKAIKIKVSQTTNTRAEMAAVLRQIAEQLEKGFLSNTEPHYTLNTYNEYTPDGKIKK